MKDFAIKDLDCFYCLNDIPKGAEMWVDQSDESYYCTEACYNGRI